MSTRIRGGSASWTSIVNRDCNSVSLRLIARPMPQPGQGFSLVSRRYVRSGMGRQTAILELENE